MSQRNVIWFEELGINDIQQVGGKNASLGEMIAHLTQANIKVPSGFATTAQAFRQFLAQNQLDQKIYQALRHLNIDDLHALKKTGEQIREWIVKTPFLPDFEKDIRLALSKLDIDKNSVAVRSSATAEDLPSASFAGQQETFLNIKGLANIFSAIKEVFASLFNDRAIVYRAHHGFKHEQVALSAGIQRMVRSDLASSGVIFTLDTESGFDQVILLTSSYGLGEPIVQGSVNPDEFVIYKPNLEKKLPALLSKTIGSKKIKMIYSESFKSVNINQDILVNNSTKIIDTSTSDQIKFSLTDPEVETLSRMALNIEKHYRRPMDIEWAKDGIDGQLYILQARPETVKSQHQSFQTLETYVLHEKGKVIVEGRSVGERIGQGTARVLSGVSEMSKLKVGDVLITDMTDPDWEPIMKKASAIVTNRGGRTCHAAIIARELGIPAVVGCQDATAKIKDGSTITVSCAEGDTGFIYEGLLPFSIKKINLTEIPQLPTKIMLNVAHPDRAFSFRQLPNDGVGLARLEFIISNRIGIHPKALLNFDQLPQEVQEKINQITNGYQDPVSFYVDRLTEGIATIAAAFYPKPVIVRTSDFKSNEYASLLGGDLFEPREENPMIGFRGASRYISETFRPCFVLECQALKRVRDEMGFHNVDIMIPFTRTVEEGKQVIKLLAENGLKRGSHGLKVMVMCEIPSNAILAEAFLAHFDGFSIGSNDLTQLTLGLDRDSSLVASLFDERNQAVKMLLEKVIGTCNQLGKYVGICGQAPSDYPDFAKWLMMDQHIQSMSLNPDAIIHTWLHLADKGETT